MRVPRQFVPTTTVIAALFAALFALGCGKSAFTAPTITVNPAPSVRLGEYKNVEMAAITIGPVPLQEEGVQVCNFVASRISQQFTTKIQYLLNAWSNDPSRPPTRDTVVIQPVITQLKWVTRGERVWAGAMYGNSAIVVELHISDKGTGTVFARPVLFTRANAMSGAWGAQEDVMITRVSELMANYIIQNHAAPVGGPSGVE